MRPLAHQDVCLQPGYKSAFRGLGHSAAHHGQWADTPLPCLQAVGNPVVVLATSQQALEELPPGVAAFFDAVRPLHFHAKLPGTISMATPGPAAWQDAVSRGARHLATSSAAAGLCSRAALPAVSAACSGQ